MCCRVCFNAEAVFRCYGDQYWYATSRNQIVHHVPISMANYIGALTATNTERHIWKVVRLLSSCPVLVVNKVPFSPHDSFTVKGTPNNFRRLKSVGKAAFEVLAINLSTRLASASAFWKRSSTTAWIKGFTSITRSK